MSDTDNKKINWLAILSVILGLLLITQTVGLVYFLSSKNKKPTPTESVEYVKPASPVHWGLSRPARQNQHRTASPLANQNAAYALQDPSSVFEAMQEDMGQMMNGFMAGLPSMLSQMNQHMGIDSMPLVDMSEKDNSYIVRVDVPGLNKDKIEITVRGEILNIQGVRETTNQEQTDSYFTQERSYGSFSRSLRLPGPVDDANV